MSSLTSPTPAEVPEWPQTSRRHPLGDDDRTPAEGWRSAESTEGWHAARWVSDGERLAITYVTAPTENTLRVAIARREAELAIAAEARAS
jgi:hypothetical protein